MDPKEAETLTGADMKHFIYCLLTCEVNYLMSFSADMPAYVHITKWSSLMLLKRACSMHRCHMQVVICLMLLLLIPFLN